MVISVENMLTYVNKEQEIGLSIIKNRKLLMKSILDESNDFNYRRIVIYATGSSSNAAYCSKLYMQELLQIPVEIQEPSMAKNYELFFQHDTLYFAVSQSGNSYSTIEVVKEAQNKGIKNLYTLTSDVNSPIANASKKVLDLGIGKEHVVFVTLGVMATTLYFDLLAIELALKYKLISEEKYHNEITEISNVVDKIDRTIEKSAIWYDKNKEKFYKAKRFISIGYGSGYGVAKEADTKITETIRVPMNGHELEEYMHGPYIGLNEKDYIIMIDPNGKLHSRMNLLRKFLDNHVENVFMISNAAEVLNIENDLKFDFSVKENLSPLLMLIPIHYISNKLSEYHKIDLTKSSYEDFDVMLKSKVNN